MEALSPIVFFDGVCNLCNGFVDFLIRRDVRGRLRFASLQGRTAHEILGPETGTELRSVVFRDEHGRITRESEAALAAIAELGSFWKLVLILKLAPRSLRDWVYRFIARNRYRWFGKRETCRLPSPKERAQFLD